MPKPGSTASLSRALEEQVVAGTLDVPVLPAVANRVLALLSEANPDPRDLGTLIGRDPVLAAHIIRIANSPSMRASGAIVDTRQAIARLGLRTVGEVSLAACLGPRLFKAPDYAKLIERTWTESLAAAVWAQLLTRRLRRHRDCAFLCGLLARIGEPVLLQAIQKLAARAQPAADIATLLRQHGPLAGTRVGKSWNLPSPVTECILWLHDFAAAGAPDLVAMIALARALAPSAVDGGVETDPAELAALPAAAACKLDAAAIAELLDARTAVAATVQEMVH
jgi:HD-like signal output (HDOD) protein